MELLVVGFSDLQLWDFQLWDFQLCDFQLSPTKSIAMQHRSNGSNRGMTSGISHAAALKRLEPGDDFRHHVGVVRPLQVGDAVSYCRNRDR